MGKILDLFKGQNAADDPPVRFDVLLDRARPYFQPALKVKKTASPSTSYLGGNPKLPQDVKWPEKNNRPLTFLGSIDLEVVAGTKVISWLPKIGSLLFFYDIDEQPWGFNPEDRGGWQVIHVTGEPEDRLGSATTLRKFFVEFEVIESVPGWERFESLGIAMSDKESDVFIDGIHESDQDEELHQMSGYPGNVQGDGMELESQLASNGINVGDPSGYQSSEARELEAGAEDWRLLFQHSGDDDQGLMWGDCGRIYFWVKEQDARQGDFSNCWLVLQCS